jgi:steroid 5-alpha reductase family enzyme
MDSGVTVWAVLGVFVLMTGFWLASLGLRNASIADIAWGLAFVVVAWAVVIAGPGTTPAIILAIAVTLWGARLAGYIAWRNHGHGEDRRYVAMREKRPGSFWLWSLFGVFLLQGLLALIISIPVQSLGATGDASLGVFSLVGGVVFLTGLFFEAVGDAQLASFKSDPANRGKVMDRGLWRYTRHPNYFGDALLWWGIWIFAVGSGAAWWTFIGPVVMTFFLLRVSGVAMLEADISERRPAYAEYIRRTSAFIPRPPRD